MLLRLIADRVRTVGVVLYATADEQGLKSRRIGSWSANNGVGAGPTSDRVVAGASPKLISSFTANDQIVAVAAENDVAGYGGGADKDVVAAKSDHDNGQPVPVRLTCRNHHVALIRAHKDLNAVFVVVDWMIGLIGIGLVGLLAVGG